MSKSEKLPTESYKGVRDFYPEEQAFLNYLFATYKRVANSFGYVEYHASVLEPAELYKVKGADNVELINEQTYTFTDRGGREVTLRPEMTPTVARMVAQKRREMGFPLRLFSIPNVFRYERPQRGRLREHWQLNVDLFGSNSPAADAEVIAFGHALVVALGGSESDFSIKVNSRSFLNDISSAHGLSADDTRALLGLLDRRAKMPAAEFEAKVRELGVPVAALNPEVPPPDVEAVLTELEALGVGNAVFDPTVVRGFSYYTGVVFEIFDTHPENNRAMFGGGRYDNLTALFDDEPIPGVGFGMGDVTVRDFLAVRGLLPVYTPPVDVYLGLASPRLLPQALRLAHELREAGVRVAQDFGEKKLGEQIKAAAKHQVPYLVVVGEDELMAGAFAVRNLETGTEEHVGRAELASYFLTIPNRA